MARKEENFFFFSKKLKISRGIKKLMFGDQYIFTTCKLVLGLSNSVKPTLPGRHIYANTLHYFQYPDSSPTINQHKAFESNFRLTGFKSRMNVNDHFKVADQLQLHYISVSKILYQSNNAQSNIL